MTKQALLALALATVVGTRALEAGSLPGFVLKGQSERILAYARPNSSVDVAGLERSLERFERLLGRRFTGRLEYYQYDYREEVALATGRYADGVTYAGLGHVHALRRVRDHEIVHVVAGQLGDPGHFFQEGLAVAVADRGRWWGRPVDDVAKTLVGQASLSALIARFDPDAPGRGYYVAGSFVSWLIKNYGVSQVGEFFRACKGRDTVPAAFAQAFGQSLDAAGASWAASL